MLEEQSNVDVDVGIDDVVGLVPEASVLKIILEIEARQASKYLPVLLL